MLTSMVARVLTFYDPTPGGYGDLSNQATKVYQRYGFMNK